MKQKEFTQEDIDNFQLDNLSVKGWQMLKEENAVR